MDKITKEMKVAVVFEQYPNTRGVFQEFGFGALMNPVLFAKDCLEAMKC